MSLARGQTLPFSVQTVDGSLTFGRTRQFTTTGGLMRPSLLDLLLSGFGLISDGKIGGLYLFREMEPMHLSVEGLHP